jgi:hypothetical protein
VPYSDDQDERRRLATTYGGMTDGELQHLARTPESLTEAAWETLEDEFDRRQLKHPNEEAHRPHEELGTRTLVTIRQFRDLPEALLAKGSLESFGIECFLRDDNMVRLDWFISNFIGGVKLCVSPQDAENAQRILDEPILEGMYVHGVGLYEQPRCPKCRSLDVAMPVQGPAWRCQSCGAEWEDDTADAGTNESYS